MTEQQLRDECAKLAAEWNLAGFANGAIYEDFAVELAKRAVMAERNRCAQNLRDAAGRLAPVDKRSSKVERKLAGFLSRHADVLVRGNQPGEPRKNSRAALALPETMGYIGGTEAEYKSARNEPHKDSSQHPALHHDRRYQGPRPRCARRGVCAGDRPDL